MTETPTTKNIIAASTTQSGLSAIGAGTAPDTITIPIAQLVSNIRANLVMVTFDVYATVNLPDPEDNPFSILSTRSFTFPSTAVKQTAVLFYSQVGHEITSPLVFTINPGEETLTAPVKWRAVGVAIAGDYVRNVHDNIVGVRMTTTQDAVRLNMPWYDRRRAYIGFFGSPMPPPTVPLNMADQVVQKARVTNEPDEITCYAWSDEGYTIAATGEGPWFYTSVQVMWDTTAYIPPPTGSDAFWALPAACESSDVFIINNNKAAFEWDDALALADPQKDAFEKKDTLLLNHIDKDGTKWILKDLDGWWTLPPPSLPDLARPGYLDGSFPIEGRYEPRIISLRGEFIPGRNIAVAGPRLRLLRSLDAVRGGALLVVKEPMGNSVDMAHRDMDVAYEWELGPWPKQSWVWLSDQPKVDTLDGTGRTEFEVQLKAVDPIKYLSGMHGLSKMFVASSGAKDGRDYTQNNEHGERYTPTPGRAYGSTPLAITPPALNKGTANISPRIYIFGPVSNARVENLTTNQVMSFQGTIQTGETLIVDCYWRTVLLVPSGNALISDSYEDDRIAVNRRWMLRLFSPWIYLRPGENELAFYGNYTDVSSDPPLPSETNKTQCWFVYRSGWTGS